MLHSYVKSSLRKFRRAKAHTFINVVGLTLGLLCALIIFQKVRFELSYDSYHTEADRLYRIVREDSRFGESSFDEGVPYPLINAFRADFPAVEHVSIVDRNFAAPVLSMMRDDGSVARFKEEDGAAFVDQDFFDLFAYEWIYGDPTTALTAPNTVVLSQSIARKYFGTDDVVGKRLTYDNDFDLVATGVVRDAPLNTILPLNILISFNLGEANRRGNDSWGSTSTNVQCYVRLPRGQSPSVLDGQLRDFLVRYRDEEAAKDIRFFLQPLSEAHFDTRFEQAVVPRSTLWALSLIGVFLLVTACINFVNLSIVIVFRRAHEVAMRKVLGGTPGQIVTYFMTETALVVCVAFVLAVALANLAVGPAAPFIGEGVSVNLFKDPTLAVSGLLAVVVLSFVSGLYPASLMARVTPLAAMRSKVGEKPGAVFNLRRVLVIFQFAITQVLIICTLIAAHQMRFVHSVPLGYETEAIVEFNIPEQEVSTLETLKSELLRSGAIQRVAFSNSGASSGNVWGSNFYYHKDGDRLENETQVKLVDGDYLDTYRMTLIAGETFAPSDSVTGFVVNEAFVDVMGFSASEDAIGTPVEAWGHRLVPIVGVVRNFNTNSLHDQIEATLLIPSIQQSHVGAAKINLAQVGDALAHVEQSWTAAFPEYLYEFEFLDDRIAQFYADEQTLQRLIQVFAGIAILIGCIGLFGLISYTTAQRAREVGIRKVLGASIPHVVGLFTREFVVMVVLGFAVSAPIAYKLMTGWLQNFAYRVDLGPGVFLAAFGISMGIAILTVALKSYRSAIANPVDVIRQN